MAEKGTLPAGSDNRIIANKFLHGELPLRGRSSPNQESDVPRRPSG